MQYLLIAIIVILFIMLTAVIIMSWIRCRRSKSSYELEVAVLQNQKIQKEFYV